MAVNYNDSRFQTVEDEKKQALNNVNNMYNNMISQNDKFYQDQQNLIKDYETTQKEIQQQQSDFTIEKINQQKDQAKQDYTKEQKASYVDYQKQSNQFGANAEAMAARGLNYTGYAESSQVSMYNTYQNRYATARETYNRAVLNYDNSIKEAQLANSSALAEISFNSMKQQLELALEGFQYKNTLLQAQLNAQNETEDRYYNRWHDVLEQINTENALAEQIRQFNANLSFEKEQFNWQKQQAAIENAQQERIIQAQTSGGSSGGGSSSSSSSKKESSSIKKSSGSGGTGAKGSGSGGGGFRGSSSSSSDTITTAYYSGKINPDAKNGTFSNGYQPDNVNGKKLKSTGQYIEKEGVTLQGSKTTTTQKIWKTSDGTKYYWDGNSNKYKKYNG